MEKTQKYILIITYIFFLALYFLTNYQTSFPVNKNPSKHVLFILSPVVFSFIFNYFFSYFLFKNYNHKMLKKCIGIYTIVVFIINIITILLSQFNIHTDAMLYFHVLFTSVYAHINLAFYILYFFIMLNKNIVEIKHSLFLTNIVTFLGLLISLIIFPSLHFLYAITLYYSK